MASDPSWSLSGGSLGKFKHHYKDPIGAKPQLLLCVNEPRREPPPHTSRRKTVLADSQEGQLSPIGQKGARNTVGAGHTLLKR